MARKLRIQYPGAIYHVMNRGDRREAISCYDHESETLHQTLAEACAKTQWQAHAFVPMARSAHYRRASARATTESTTGPRQ